MVQDVTMRVLLAAITAVPAAGNPAAPGGQAAQHEVLAATAAAAERAQAGHLASVDRRQPPDTAHHEVTGALHAAATTAQQPAGDVALPDDTASAITTQSVHTSICRHFLHEIFNFSV